MKHQALILTGLLILSTGCTSTRVQRIGTAEYNAVRDPEAVRLFLGDVSRPYREIAWIDSFSAVEKDREVKREQLAELRREAARIGADAIIEIQSLKEMRRGMTNDPRTPFPAWEQARTEMNFLRGKAVRFVEEEQALEREEERAGMELIAPETGETPSETALDEIPEVPAPRDSTPDPAPSRPGY
ncbi:MAG: hypothetical protein PWP23_937 [Candidatus Sumerlaeota bacterium]|nr:hypothetical protein [Candidatus Sumerlaeota bacterium]